MPFFGAPTAADKPADPYRDERISKLLNELTDHRHKYPLRANDTVRKQMRVLNDLDPNKLSSGGALLGVDPIVALQIGMVATSAMRANAEILGRLGNYAHIVPTLDDVANEGVIVTPSNPSTTVDMVGCGRRKFNPVIFSSTRLKVSRVVETDAARLMPGIMFALGQRLARKQNREFTVGEGHNGPQGIVPAAGVGVTAASATAIATDEVLRLVGSVNAFYRQTASLMMNTTTWTVLATAKDGQGQYAWRLAGLHEFPLVLNDHMPDIAAGAKPIVYGDLSAYKIFDLGEVTIQRFVEEYVAFYESAYEAWLQSDGALADASGNAVHALQMAAE